MSNDSLRARNIDDAIDRAIREMVQIDPLPGLRFRVLARLERPPRGGGSGWLRALTFVRSSWEPIAAIAIVAIAVAVLVPRYMRESTPPLATQSVATPTIQNAAPASPPAAAPPAVRLAQPAPTSRTRTRAADPAPESIFGPRTGRVSAAASDVAKEPVPVEPAGSAATPIEAGTLRPLAPLRPIEITPITITPISVRPIIQ